MAESDKDERTEDATPRRREEAQKKGQVARSRELASVAVLVAGALALMMFGADLAVALQQLMAQFFALSRAEIFDFSRLLLIIFSGLSGIMLPLVAILLLLFIIGLVGSAGIGGIFWSWEAARPKWSKLNPLAGLKRMIGRRSIVELVKSILKISLVSGVALLLMWLNIDDIYRLNRETFPANLFHALDILLNFILLICCSLIIVVAIDVPFQLWQHNKELKMTKQEIKDEYKEMEGRPEVKGRIRMLQREMAQRRMMAEVVSADVIIVNPEHYSVALRYDSALDDAPIVVAKGSDFLALKMREIAAEHAITIVPAPPLCRALFYSTELEQPIPDALFVAVAQILAYVFQLKHYQQGRGTKPEPIQDKHLPIPPEFIR